MTPILTALACVILLNAYAALLILLRAKVYGVPLYRPMLVNIGLSLAPVALAFIGLIGFLVVAPAALSPDPYRQRFRLPLSGSTSASPRWRGWWNAEAWASVSVRLGARKMSPTSSCSNVLAGTIRKSDGLKAGVLLMAVSVSRGAPTVKAASR